MKLYLSPATDGTEGSSQGGTSPELDTAMGGWGEGEQAAATTETSTSAPAQTQQSTQRSEAPAQGAASATASASAPAAAPVPAAPAQDTAALIRAAVESTAQAMQRTQGQTRQMEQAQRTMTDDEFNARYGITKYDAKAIERLFDKDPAKAADVLNEIQRNAYTAAVRMANDLVAAQIAQQQAQYAPQLKQVQSFIAEQNERQATDRFYKSYPALGPEADLVKEVLDATQAKIARGELKFTDEKTAFQYVADATNRVVSRMKQSGGSGSGQQSPAGTRQMATASQSARPGGAPASRKGDLDTVMSSWDESPAE